jgi:hypothetical protein
MSMQNNTSYSSAKKNFIGKQAALADLIPYNRAQAIEYANIWALGRNPAYYDYSNLGALPFV